MDLIMGKTTHQKVVFVRIDSGPYHTCAMDMDGGVECWGRNDVGQTDVPEGSFRPNICRCDEYLWVASDGDIFAGAMRKMMIRGMWM